MRPIPSLPQTVERIAFKLGFQLIHQLGSHRRYKSSDGRTLIIAFHKDRDVPIGTLRKIISDMGISVEEFNEMV